MARIDEQPLADPVVADTLVDVPEPLIRWSAIFAGLFFVLASSSLMMLLGSALGLGVADVSDGDALGEGLGIATLVWMLLTTIVAFFLGSLLTARVNGSHEDAAGVLSGITLWSIGTVLIAYLTTVGVMGAAKMGSGAVAATVGGVVTAGGATAAGGGLLKDTSLGDQVAAMVKSQLAEQLSEGAPAGNAPNTVPTAPAVMDAEAADVEQPAPTPPPAEIRQALDEIDTQTLQDIGVALVKGDTEGAKSILALKTSLSREEIDAVIDGVSDKADRAIAEAQDKITRAADKAADYAQAFIWAAFVSGALGLVVSIVGGMLGARTGRHLYRLHRVR